MSRTIIAGICAPPKIPPTVVRAVAKSDVVTWCAQSFMVPAEKSRLEAAQGKCCDQTHLMGSIERREADVGGIFVDANNEQVVSYVNKFLLIGDAGQQ